MFGLLLAAGGGSRMGMPKALVHAADGTAWVRRSARVLIEGGCEQVFVVLGAGAERAIPLLDGLQVEIVVASDWTEGMGVSLRAGLAAVSEAAVQPDGVLVSLIDLPDVDAEVVARLLAAAAGPSDLMRASYDGTPGHPVLIGWQHLAPMSLTLRGDVGARAYLDEHGAALVECGDLATGGDVDTPEGRVPPTPRR